MKGRTGNVYVINWTSTQRHPMTSQVLVHLCHGIQMSWYLDVMVPICHGTHMSWYPNVMVSKCHGTQISWYLDVMVLECCGIQTSVVWILISIRTAPSHCFGIQEPGSSFRIIRRIMQTHSVNDDASYKTWRIQPTDSERIWIGNQH